MCYGVNLSFFLSEVCLSNLIKEVVNRIHMPTATNETSQFFVCILSLCFSFCDNFFLFFQSSSEWLNWGVFKATHYSGAAPLFPNQCRNQSSMTPKSMYGWIRRVVRIYMLSYSPIPRIYTISSYHSIQEVKVISPKIPSTIQKGIPDPKEYLRNKLHKSVPRWEEP